MPEGTAIRILGRKRLRDGVTRLDQGFEHPFSDLEVGDNAVFHGTHSVDFARGFAQHGFGFMADSQHFVGDGVDSDDRGFGQDDAFASHKDEGIGGS